MTTVWVCTDHCSYRAHTYFCFYTEDNKKTGKRWRCFSASDSPFCSETRNAFL